MDYSAIQRIWQSPMTQVDSWMAALLEREEQRQFQQISLGAVSYTHLTLPTNREV